MFSGQEIQAKQHEAPFLSYEEEQTLLTWLDDNKLVRDIVIVALHTRMRRGEIFDLQWMDVDIDRDRILVRKTKSSKERFIPMNETVKQLLLSLPQTGEYVFPSPQAGGKLTDIKKSFGSAVKVAGIKNFRFHDLRHTFATRLADEATDPFTLMSLLGHADL
jgi:integrase